MRRLSGIAPVFPELNLTGSVLTSDAQFNTKLKDQLFCPKCGVSIGIDFRDVNEHYGISVR